MLNSIFVITLVLSIRIWWSKAFWKAVALAQLVKQFLEALVLQFARNSTEEVRRPPNKISVAHDLPNHLTHHVESSNLQRREGYDNPSQWANEISVKQAQQQRLGLMWSKFVVVSELRYFIAA